MHVASATLTPHRAVYHLPGSTETLMFPPTQPMREADDAPAPSVRRPLQDLDAPADVLHTALSSLSPSLMQDLQRFDPASPQRELLEVLAACMRHTQALAIELDGPRGPLTLSVFPLDSMKIGRAHV